ncbi:MAG: hypothetical protein J6Z06_05650, partial [Lachnospiraceae bacterium]|nr:hypothetical protein [Lachnospiraceae bacterium]
MQISDLVNQYQNSLAAGSEISTKTKGVEQLVSTVSTLKEGQVFEGTVNSIKNGTVILGLSSGQNITARLDKGIQLLQGQSVFFQVKSNEGGLVQIKPISTGFTNNPTLLTALDAASLPVNEKTLNMVNAMMKEQMPIDAKSVADMSRQVIMHPNADVGTVVSLNKLGIPVTDGMAAQFENYRNSEGAILKTVDDLAMEIPVLLDGEDVTKDMVLSFQKELVNNVFQEKQDVVMTQAGLQTIPNATEGEAASSPAMVTPQNPEAQATSFVGTQAESLMERMQGATGTSAGTEQVAYEIMIEGEDAIPEEVAKSDAFGKLVAELEENRFDKGSIGNALNPKAYQELSEMVRQWPSFSEMNKESFDATGRLKMQLPVEDLLKQVTDYMEKNTAMTKADVMRFIKSDAFRGLTKELFAKE